MKSKKNTNIIMTVILIVLFILVIVLGFFMANRKLNYKRPISIYYDGINKKSEERVLKAYHPCLGEDKIFRLHIEQALKPLKAYKDASYSYKVKTKEELKESKIKDYQAAYNGMETCKNISIKKAYLVTLKQSEKMFENGEKTSKEVEIPVAYIDDNWYLLR